MERNTNYYADIVARRYPGIPLAEVRAICQRLMRRIYTHAYYNRDVRIYSAARNLSLKIYTHVRSVEDHNQQHEAAARVQRLLRFRQRRKRPMP